MPKRGLGEVIRNRHNEAPAKEVPHDIGRSAARAEFGRRLQAQLDKSGLSQTDLAKRATDYMPGGKVVGRDSISAYIGGLQFPTSARLHAIAKALKIEPRELVPTKGIKTSADKDPDLDVRNMADGMAWLRINQQVPWTDAVKILAILKGEEKTE